MVDAARTSPGSRSAALALAIVLLLLQLLLKRRAAFSPMIQQFGRMKRSSAVENAVELFSVSKEMS